MIPEPLTQRTPRPVGRGAFVQHWRDLTMLHWPVDPALVAPLLPRGTAPDLLDGQTYVGLVPFLMRGVRVLGSPPLPWLSEFAETNVRLYAVDEQGRRGVVFRSLEASRLLPVLVARATYRLPYLWADMHIRHGADTVAYSTRRRWPGPRGAASTVRVRIGDRYDADPLSEFLTARWGLFSSFYGGTSVHAPVEHDPWGLHRAELLHLEDELVELGGLSVSGPPHVLWSPGVRVRIGRPEPLHRSSRSSTAMARSTSGGGDAA